MMQVTNGTIQELTQTLTTTGVMTSGNVQACGDYFPTTTVYISPYTYYHSYPVYVCTDKTKKAIDILKHLQAKKRIKCDDVPQFIALVEEIAGLL